MCFLAEICQYGGEDTASGDNEIIRNTRLMINNLINNTIFYFLNNNFSFTYSLLIKSYIITNLPAERDMTVNLASHLPKVN